MSSGKMCDLPHVSCIVIDSNTVRYGGSEFTRITRCKDCVNSSYNENTTRTECNLFGATFYDGKGFCSFAERRQ